MSPFGLFRKKQEETKLEQQPQEIKPAAQEQPAIAEPAPEPAPVIEEKAATEQPIVEEKIATEQQPATEEKPQIEAPAPAPAKIETEPVTYLRAMPLRELEDIESVENEVKKGNIIILRITPLASKSIDEVKQAVDQLYAFAESIKGDIARLGEERIVICPEKIRIWREKTPEKTAPLPTAA